MRIRNLLGLTALALMAAHATNGSGEQTATPSASAKSLLEKDLVGAAGKELILLTVEYVPGGASQPHRHDAQVFVYVLEGELTMQVKGSPAVNLRAGDTFYEGRGDVHLVSANASQQAPAKILVFMVKDKGVPASRPAS